MGSTLSNAQLSELQQAHEQALVDFRAIDKTLEYTMAGTGLSDGGREKIIGMLENQFVEVQRAAANMPDELEPFSSEERTQALGQIISTMESMASMYLFMDYFRPNAGGGWFMSSAKKQMAAEYNRIMDERAWAALMTLKMAKSYLPMMQRAMRHI